MRKAELERDRHLDRLRERQPESVETTSLHLDVLATQAHPLAHLLSSLPGAGGGGELPVRDSERIDVRLLIR